MDIESFYEQNEARRESAEFEFGGEWTDVVDNEYELSWVEATGELYLMVEPDAVVTEDAFGDFYTHGEEVTDLTVVIIGKSASLAALEDTLLGWEDAMLEPTHSRGCTNAFRRRRTRDRASTNRRPCRDASRTAPNSSAGPLRFVDRRHQGVPTPVDRRRVGRLRRRLQQLTHGSSLERVASGRGEIRCFALGLDGDGALH